MTIELAGETRSDARVASEGPRATIENAIPFIVGRGPVPRRASAGETALAGVQFSRRSSDRGGQAPALRTNLANRANPVNPAPLLLIL